MSPEQIQAAILAAVVSAILATIASVTVMIRMMPNILKAREAEREARYQDALKERDLARKKDLAEIRDNFEQSKANLSMISTISESLKAMTAALVNTQTQNSEGYKIIVANTNAVGDVTEALVDMAERIGILINTGTPNVIKKLDDIAAFIKNTSIDRTTFERNNLELLMDVRDRLAALETQARDTVKQVEKHISKPMPPITPDMLADTTDGKPPTQ